MKLRRANKNQELRSFETDWNSPSGYSACPFKGCFKSVITSSPIKRWNGSMAFRTPSITTRSSRMNQSWWWCTPITLVPWICREWAATTWVSGISRQLLGQKEARVIRTTVKVFYIRINIWLTYVTDSVIPIGKRQSKSVFQRKGFNRRISKNSRISETVQL